MSHGKIAVVAAAVRCAGADGVAEFENLLDACRPQFCDAPADRWPDSSVPVEGFQSSANRAYSNQMAAVADPYALDGFAYRIPRTRLQRMDPQQRLAINVAADLFGSGARPAEEVEQRWGVTATVLGCVSTDYRGLATWKVTNDMMLGPSREALSPGAAHELARVENLVENMDGHSLPGVMSNMIAGSVASSFDLTGPAFTVDAACASSLSAVDVGCLLLRSGRVDSCIAGGVYLALTPEILVGFSGIGAVSPSGRCLPFEQAADGFVLGEGAGMVLLRRLEDAVADGDDIWCVIDAVGSSNDGRAPGVMTPTREGQVRAIDDAWRQAGLPDRRIDAIEAHGTGTVVGDAIELDAVSQALVNPDRPVPIGSLKAIIGHTMSASAVLSLVKVALALRRGTWFPQPPPKAEWNDHLDTTAFYVPTGFGRHDPVRRVVLNSFGFGGTNYHAICSSPEADDAA